MSPFEQMLPKMTDDEADGQMVTCLRPKGDVAQGGFTPWLETVLIQTGHAGADQIRSQVALQEAGEESGSACLPSRGDGRGSRIPGAAEAGRPFAWPDPLRYARSGLRRFAGALAPLAARLG